MMDFGVREIVALLVLLVLVGVAIGLLLRYRRSQYGRIKSRARYRPGKSDDAGETREYGSELPSGGARVVAYRDPDDITTVHQRIRQQAEASRPKLSMFKEKPEQTSLGLEEESEADIPMLLDPAEMEPELPVEPIEDEVEEEVDPLFMEKISAPRDNPVEESAPEPEPQPEEPSVESSEPEQDEPEGEEPETDDGPLEVLVLNVMAADGKMLSGEEVHEALVSQGLKFGEMDIYHFDRGGQGAKGHFSVANILNPGTFKADMAEFATPGLCFFMTLSLRGSNQERFDKMLDASMRVTDQLGARLHDEQRSVISGQTLEHYRNRIRDFERRRMLR